MKLYIAGPLFTPGERHYLEGLADRLGADGHECFVPHLETKQPLTAETIFATDCEGLYGSDAVVAWLDGPMVDDGTACEIGIFSELVRSQPDRYKGIVGLATDWRTGRRRDAGMTDGGLNFFVGGAIMKYGRLVWTTEEVQATLADWSGTTP